jgi:hypothetical protein
MIHTFEEAYQFVLAQKVCTVFGSKNSPYPSLWDNTALSEEKPKAGGDAVLMEMRHFRSVHYPEAFQPVGELDSLSQQVYELIRLEPNYTGPVRKLAIARQGCTKSQFDTALKNLQISLNIIRSNDPALKNDFWLPMREVHLEIVRE